MRARRPLLAVLAVSVALAGCAGGDDRLTKAAYEQRVRAVYANVQAAFQETRGVSGGELAARVSDAQAALRDAAAELDGVAPEEVAEENALLVFGMREYADALDEVREAAEDDDTAAIDAFNERQRYSEAIEQMEEAAEAMKNKGYDLGPIAKD